MAFEKGSISIHTENILPIIKKWLYSEKDIFIRELVSNSNDAITKFRRLTEIGEAEPVPNEKYAIRVEVNKDTGTIRFIDNGIGMTGDEVKKYINQIAFSGAQDFLERYKDKMDESGQIIGHFGLGFYSAFMVAEKIRIDTLSWEKDTSGGAIPVRWESSGASEYEMDESDRSVRGTEITLFVNDDGKEFLDEYKMREALLKYCYFLPYEIFLEDMSEDAVKAREKARKEAEEKAKKENKGIENKELQPEAQPEGTPATPPEAQPEAPPATPPEAKPEAPPLNDTHPLWIKNPKDCTDDDYKSFYRKVFHDFNDPLFWIHLNMDYPFNLKGILYFPKLKHEFETMEGQIKLYYNQVFVADNIKEVIPEFLLLLKGTLDCPDLPLNVSRSFLQNDGYVKKLSAHITKKVADKLTSLFENERDNYNKYWDDINPFVKYGCIREAKFYEKVKDVVIYKTINGDFTSLKDYLERNKDKHKDKVFYVTDELQQSQYIRLFKEQGMEAVMLSTMIDSHFIQFLEMKETGVTFSRVDADLSDSMKAATDENDQDAKEIAAGIEKLFKEAIGEENLKIQVENLKAGGVPAVMLLSEYSRRMQDMSRFYGMFEKGRAPAFPEERTLVLNGTNSLIKILYKIRDDESKKEDIKMICSHIFDIAMMSHKQLDSEAMTKFIDRSNTILFRLAEMEAKEIN